MPSDRSFGILEKQRREAIKYFENEIALIPEAVGGLYSYIEGSEDVTCFTLKKTYGKRDKAREPI